MILPRFAALHKSVESSTFGHARLLGHSCLKSTSTISALSPFSNFFSNVSCVILGRPGGAGGSSCASQERKKGTVEAYARRSCPGASSSLFCTPFFLKSQTLSLSLVCSCLFLVFSSITAITFSCSNQKSQTRWLCRPSHPESTSCICRACLILATRQHPCVVSCLPSSSCDSFFFARAPFPKQFSKAFFVLP